MNEIMRQLWVFFFPLSLVKQMYQDDENAVVEEYVKTMRRVLQIIDNMLLHFQLQITEKSSPIKQDADEQFASRPIRRVAKK